MALLMSKEKLHITGIVMTETDQKPLKMEDESDGTNLVSSTNLNPESREIFVEDIQNPLSITTVLNYCKDKILNPYLRILSLLGLRPLLVERDRCVVLEILSYGYIIQVVAFLVVGYFLQYMACFRRDRGFGHIPETHLLEARLNLIYEESCGGSAIFSFAIPSILHFTGFIHALITFRRTDDDQLPVLIERVFVSSSNLTDGFVCQKKLVKTLWFCIFGSLIWVILSFISVSYMMAQEEILFKWIDNDVYWSSVLLKILLVICTLWQDTTQSIIITNYCLQAQLLITYVTFMREKLLQYSVSTIEWIRDIEDFRKLLCYFNTQTAPAVCLFTIANLSFAFSGSLWLLKFDHLDKQTLPLVGLRIVNVGLWALIAAAPFIQAARLTHYCESFKSVGQEVRTRPFVHQDTPSCELDTILLYTTSLNISAKLFYIPINGKYLCLIMTLITIFILVLGQCHYLNF